MSCVPKEKRVWRERRSKSDDREEKSHKDNTEKMPLNLISQRLILLLGK
jgi:hypothetical protein